MPPPTYETGACESAQMVIEVTIAALRDLEQQYHPFPARLALAHKMCERWLAVFPVFPRTPSERAPANAADGDAEMGGGVVSGGQSWPPPLSADVLALVMSATRTMRISDQRALLLACCRVCKACVTDVVEDDVFVGDFVVLPLDGGGPNLEVHSGAATVEAHVLDPHVLYAGQRAVRLAHSAEAADRHSVAHTSAVTPDAADVNAVGATVDRDGVVAVDDRRVVDRHAWMSETGEMSQLQMPDVLVLREMSMPSVFVAGFLLLETEDAVTFDTSKSEEKEILMCAARTCVTVMPVRLPVLTLINITGGPPEGSEGGLGGGGGGGKEQISGQVQSPPSVKKKPPSSDPNRKLDTHGYPTKAVL
ncbi:hypothetical protein BDK51DRAFT_47942 [Blyttiomyces helicus]|uniref:Uncharacterized protein n=1 Tax=Blyttiomyces helicus TaxID=388810 RepID=A0A4P9VYP5_9FUNG|nr:hypothetical protein BDK51DRAFT_47942 [Blyttiomyces helicus]|eukprot:RKO82916.1 hypothetical protein BDK51DRAFT_47942 [Blyttiomyces helicus]